MRLFKVICVVLLMMTLPGYGQSLDMIFLGKKYTLLEDAMRVASKKQALYAYNISNLSTPGFKPVLTPDDQKMLDQLTVPNKSRMKEVLLEFLMARMSENNKRYNAYLTLWKAKTDNNKRIVTLGK